MESKGSEAPKFKPNPDLKLMDQVREVLRYHYYAYRTEQAYCQWILRFIKFFGGKVHPQELDAQDVERFLSHLVVNDNVSAGTQRQALNALIFLYRNVLFLPIEDKLAPVKSKRQQRPPTVLSNQEVLRLLAEMDGKHLLMAKLLYGCGLRLMECLRLRVQDIDLDRGLVFIRGGKGGKDRTSILPKSLMTQLRLQLEMVKGLHLLDAEEGFGSVYVPDALSRKYPHAHQELAWQWVFPAKNRSIDPRSGREMRHHVLESGLQKAVKESCCTGRNYQKGRVPHSASQLCHAYVGKWHQHPCAARAHGPCRCEDDGDLHPCDEPRYPTAGEPVGSPLNPLQLSKNAKSRRTPL